MTATRVKICGINEPAALEAAAGAGADWVGFVFYEFSPRALTAEAAARLSARVAGGPRRVGLFVDPDNQAIARVLAAVPLDAVQLHGVDAMRAAAIRRRIGRPVWRAVSVAGRDDLPAQADGVDALLLDARPPEGGAPGGNALAFDWELLRGWTPGFPWLLAGGLTPANVGAAVAATGAEAVDVSSGVERRRGIKDPELIRRFVAAARGRG